MRKHNAKGFTLIELLVVIAIIGVLSTLAVVALNSARQKSRDSKRVADVKQMQTSLELYFADNNGYPAAPAAVTGVCAAGVLGCGDAEMLCNTAGGNGWMPSTATCTTTYMGLVPTAPTPADGGCAAGVDVDTAGTNDYSYTQLSSGASYEITFCLGANVGDLTAGVRTASRDGMN